MYSRLLKVGLGLAILGGAMAANAQDVPWQVDGGAAAVQFFPEGLRAHGIEVQGIQPTATGEFPMEHSAAFQILRSSNLQFMTENQNFGYHVGGSVNIRGGFALRSGKRSLSFLNPRVTANGAEPTANLLIQSGISSALLPALIMENVAPAFDVVRGEVVLGFADLKLSKEAAQALGRPEAEGLLIGSFTIWSTAFPTQAIPKPVRTGGNFLDNVNADVALHNLSSFTNLGRTGAFPNGINGFASLTTSCNKGTTNIDWFAPMNENHPVIAQQLYRIMNGRIEQIGAAYLKHGFLATNTGSASCGNPNGQGGGSQLFPGLIDTYGTGNNGDRFYLGPRSEVNPHTGVWTAFGSFFDVGTGGAVPDGQRSLTSAQVSAMPVHLNRVEVRDSDLQIPVGESRQYLFEAFYLCEQEINLQNQIGCKQTNINPVGSPQSSWSASDVGAFIPNVPAIDQYVTMTNATKNIPAGDVNATSQKVNDLSEGWIYMASNPVRLGGGLWRYELTLFNYTSDRQVREIKLPMMPGMTVTNIGFRDVDQNAGNNWTGSYDSATGEIAWSTETFAQNPNANSLKYGSMYNFTFTANVSPVSNVGALGLFKTGAIMSNTVNTIAPPNGNVVPATYIKIIGTQISGTAANLATSDDQYVIIDEDRSQDFIHLATAQISATSPIANPGQIHLEIESRGDLNGRDQLVEFYNFQTLSWVPVHFTSITTTDTTTTATVTGAGAAVYVHPTTREIRARLSMDIGAQELVPLARYRIDKAKWLIGL